jgi:hypothetical protein
VIARTLFRFSLLRIVSLRIGADMTFVVASWHTDLGSESNVLALASPRPLTAVCG